MAVALVLCLASAAAAQFGRGFGFGFRSRFPPRFPKADTFGVGFNFCRGIYTSTRGEAGGQGWSTDYPDADLNFSIRLSELTRTRVKFDAEGRPDFVTVRLTDDALFQCPYLHMEDVGTVTFSPREVEALRAYLMKGGFLWVDDFWGSYAWADWVDGDWPRAAAERVSHPGSDAVASDLSHAVPDQRVSADPVDPVVARQPARDVRAWRGQRRHRTSAPSSTRAATSWC